MSTLVPFVSICCLVFATPYGLAIDLEEAGPEPKLVESALPSSTPPCLEEICKEGLSVEKSAQVFSSHPSPQVAQCHRCKRKQALSDDLKCEQSCKQSLGFTNQCKKSKAIPTSCYQSPKSPYRSKKAKVVSYDPEPEQFCNQPLLAIPEPEQSYEQPLPVIRQRKKKQIIPPSCCHPPEKSHRCTREKAVSHDPRPEQWCNQSLGSTNQCKKNKEIPTSCYQSPKSPVRSKKAKVVSQDPEPEQFCKQPEPVVPEPEQSCKQPLPVVRQRKKKQIIPPSCCHPPEKSHRCTREKAVSYDPRPEQWCNQSLGSTNQCKKNKEIPTSCYQSPKSRKSSYPSKKEKIVSSFLGSAQLQADLQRKKNKAIPSSCYKSPKTPHQCKREKAVSYDPMYEECACFKLNSYFLAHGGWRFDKVACTTGVLFPNNYQMLDESLIAKHLQIYEAGGRALFAFDANWYLKAFYSYGWIVQGNFSDLSITGRQRGFVQDALAGLGYLFPINRSCSLGVLGGWGFNEQETSLKHANPSQYENLEFQSIWNGPWLGLDFFAWKHSQAEVNLGYEFHLTNWRGAWTLEQNLPGIAFSDKRKGGMSFGHVAYLDLAWNFGANWKAILELKYQNWSTQSTGYLNSTQMAEFDSAPIVGPVSAVTFIKEVEWVSYGISLNIGYSF